MPRLPKEGKKTSRILRWKAVRFSIQRICVQTKYIEIHIFTTSFYFKVSTCQNSTRLFFSSILRKPGDPPSVAIYTVPIIPSLTHCHTTLKIIHRLTQQLSTERKAVILILQNARQQHTHVHTIHHFYLQTKGIQKQNN